MVIHMPLASIKDKGVEIITRPFKNKSINTVLCFTWEGEQEAVHFG